MDRSPTILVTGGAGYVGSHCVAELIDRGHRVVVIDNLSQGHRAAVPDAAEFVQADLSDRAALAWLFAGRRFDAVLHVAARSLVGESMRDPHGYLHDNLVNALNLIQASVRVERITRAVSNSNRTRIVTTTGSWKLIPKTRTRRAMKFTYSPMR